MRKICCAGLLLLGIGGIVAGIFAGQHTDVFMKAVRICMECIGIG